MAEILTSKQRVLATIRNEPVDKIPVHHIQFSMHAGSVILGRPAAIGGGGLRWADSVAGELELRMDPEDPVPTHGGPNRFILVE